MKTPSPDDLLLAAEWLRQYDDDHDDGTARCAAVAEWLTEQAAAASLRAAAREHGVPVSGLRRMLARAGA